MNLIDLASEIELFPKRTASTNGGEYHSACPFCRQGTDRFIIWPVQDRYWCRTCEKKGDSIQFCRDVFGLDYRSACAKIGVKAKTYYFHRSNTQPRFLPQLIEPPPGLWQAKVKDFTQHCHQQLLNNPVAMQLLVDRGFQLETISHFLLGWNQCDRFLSLMDWGLPNAFKPDGKEKKLWLPKGIVIPSVGNHITKLKIRRSTWREGDKLPKYVEISGSMKCPSFFGAIALEPIILVESELDAMLIQQFASDLCCCLAIGGVKKKPDLTADRILGAAQQIWFALDFDRAGKEAFPFWKSMYPSLRPWPAPEGKSPGDALKMGVDLREWVLIGLKKYGSE
jgi:DNA primase